MHPNSKLPLLLALLLPSSALLACDFRPGDDAERDPNRGLSGGTVVSRHLFDRDKLDDKFYNTASAEEWSVVDGELHSKGTRNKPVWLKQPLPDNVRVEFDARSESADGDIKVEIFGDGKHHESGYVLIFGGWKNTINAIARLDEHGEDRKTGPDKKVEPGRTYHMAIVRTDNELRWFIDRELFMTYDDKNPLRGDSHRYFAFNDWAVPVYFDNLAIYELP